jgi:hypothetical protein
MSAIDIKEEKEILRVTSSNRDAFFVVPASMWHAYELALAGAEEEVQGEEG